jgi:hypothetical protein
MDSTDTFVSFTVNYSGMHSFFSRPSWGSLPNRIHIVQNTQPIYGTGQGSTGSPTIWGLILTKLIETQEAAASGAVFTSPDKCQSVRICSVSFVDDTNTAVNRRADRESNCGCPEME